MLTILFCAALGAVLNRFSGMENIAKLPGRNIYYAAVALFLIADLTVGWAWGLALALGALVYRLPGWHKSIDMGKNEGTLGEDAWTMAMRGLYFAPPFLYAMVLRNDVSAPLLLVFSAFAATGAYILGNYVLVKYMKDPYVAVEALAGAAFGAAVGVMLTH